MGIEPTQPAWKAGILPLNYTRTATFILALLSPFVKIYFHKFANFFIKQVLFLTQKHTARRPYNKSFRP